MASISLIVAIPTPLTTVNCSISALNISASPVTVMSTTSESVPLKLVAVTVSNTSIPLVLVSNFLTPLR